MQRILNNEQEQLLRRERSLLEELRLRLTRLDASEDDLALLKRSLKGLDELFLLVVVGEFNAGKSAFLNALLGSRLLSEGVTPTTSQIHLLRYGSPPREETLEHDFRAFYLPVDWLQEVNLVDTPGTNAVIQHHQEITEHFVPRSDLVLFVTSVDRPFSESERAFLERIRQWGKKIVVVVNKIDLIEEAADERQILDFVRENSRRLLGIDPEIFPVSSRLALQAKIEAQTHGTAPAGERWERSRFDPLERFIRSTLDPGERLQLKFINPLGVADRMIAKYREVIGDRQNVLKGDYQTLDTIDEQLAAYESDMRRDFVYHISHVDNVLYAMAERGDRFFDDTLRITRIFDLMNSEKLRGEFEREVMADTSREIEMQVNDLIDWMVEQDFRQWRAIMEYLNERTAQHAERMVGQVDSSFEFNRQNLIASIGRDARRVVDSYDRTSESLKLAQDVQKAIVQTAAVEVGAIGLGALMVALLHTTLLDVTGILGASAVAALGLYVLPYRRAKIKAELREQINMLRQRLHGAIRRQFDVELGESVQRIREAVAPYTRFVRVEREKLERLEAGLTEDAHESAAIRAALGQLAQSEEWP